MNEKMQSEAAVTATTLYLVVHEVFGIHVRPNAAVNEQIQLVTPVVPAMQMPGGNTMPEHIYKVARFKNGSWWPLTTNPTTGPLPNRTDYPMGKGATYSIGGVKMSPPNAQFPPDGVDSQYNPCVPDKYDLDPNVQPHCTWKLPLPKTIHQLRLISIPGSARPLYLGSTTGSALNAQLKNAISLVQVFEYEIDPGQELAIFKSENGGVEVKVTEIDYTLGAFEQSINLHVWAQVEDERGINDGMADGHAALVVKLMVTLFKGLQFVAGNHSLSINDLYSVQNKMPDGLAFLELMTLAEKFRMQTAVNVKKNPKINFCSARTCGHGGTLYVQGN